MQSFLPYTVYNISFVHSILDKYQNTVWRLDSSLVPN